MDEWIHFQYAIYYLPSPSMAPSIALQKALSDNQASPTRVDVMPDEPGAALVCARLSEDVQESYAPPDMESLRYFGRGLTRGQAIQLQSCRQAFILDFGHPRAVVWDALRQANLIAESVAGETGGLIWDEQTREVFTPAEWHKKRIESWPDAVPDVSDHFTIHCYRSGEYVRAITMGMSKVGLPDVVVEEFSWSSNRTVGILMNLFCQAIAEGGVAGKAGEFDLDLSAIQNRKVRDAQIEALKPNATSVALLTVSLGEG